MCTIRPGGAGNLLCEVSAFLVIICITSIMAASCVVVERSLESTLNAA